MASSNFDWERFSSANSVETCTDRGFTSRALLILFRLSLRCQHLKQLRREVGGRGRSREPVRIAAHIRCAKVLWRQGTSNRGHQCFSHRTPALSAAHQKLAEAYLGQVQRGQEPLGRLHPWGICSDVSRPVEQPMHCPHYKELAYIRLAPMTVHKRGSSWQPPASATRKSLVPRTK